MPLWRSPEIEAVLGGPLDETGLTEAAYAGLVTAGARESEQLEFKRQPYPPAPAPVVWTTAQELAKDVASFANHRGGVILIGVEEQDEIAVTHAPAVADPAATEQRFRQALANNLAPAARVAVVATPAAAGGHYLAVVVPPSPAAPHAVVGGPGDGRRPLHYPVRDGASTRWMTETEVADRYRRRLAGAQARRERTAGAVLAGIDALRRAAGLWLYVASVPDSPVPGPLDRAGARDIAQWWQQEYRFATPNERYLRAEGRPIPAPGRVTITGSPFRQEHEAADPRDTYIELHVDGTAFAATPVAFNTDDDADDAARASAVGEVTLAEETLLAVDACLSWTVRQAGSWGTAEVVIGLVDADAEPPALGRPVVLVGTRFGDLRRLDGTRAITVAPQATVAADLAAAAEQHGRLVTAHNALAGLLQHFGLAEPTQLTADGAVVTRTWGVDQRHVERWADDHGVPHQERPEP
jgi:hypothetical protein